MPAERRPPGRPPARRLTRPNQTRPVPPATTATVQPPVPQRPCEPPAIARAPRILDKLGEALRISGLVGETRVAKLVFLAVASRFLERPVSLAVKGPSSGGKSHVVAKVLAFFPSAAVYPVTAMSDRALAYSDEPLQHRMLVIYEAAAIRGHWMTYLLRSLLSEGCVRYETVESTPAGLRPRKIVREGPTGLIVTSTGNLHGENETGMLSVTVTDSPEQTRAVMEAEADRPASSSSVDQSVEWHALHDWLSTGTHRVVVPFGPALARSIPPMAIRLRRDFSLLLNLVRTHALLHRATRHVDSEGSIVATGEDYEAIYELTADLFSEGVQASVDPRVRATVEAVTVLLAAWGRASVLQVAELLGLDKATGLRRVRAAIRAGYLRNLQPRSNQEAILRIDAPMPDDLIILPPPAAIAGCTVAPSDRGEGGPA